VFSYSLSSTSSTIIYINTGAYKDCTALSMASFENVCTHGCKNFLTGTTMNKNYRALIFDLDGTLWDVTEAVTRGFNSAYKKNNLELHVEVEFVRSFTGKSASECTSILLEKVPEHLKAQVQYDLDREEVIAIKEHAIESLYPGVKKGLEKLSEKYLLLLVSNCGDEYLKTFLLYSSVGDVFLDSECYGRTLRPKSENIVTILKRHNLQSACYIGDTQVDEEAAEIAGIDFYFAEYGFGSTVKKHHTFKQFSDLEKYFIN
jgi:phosphoglycolate phosphatase